MTAFTYPPLKVLITGHKGFLGSHLTKILSGYIVRGWDRNSGNDIFDDKFEKAMKWANVVIHLAAYTSVNKSFGKEKDVHYLNILATARVLQLAIKHNTKMIFVSTGAVYNRDLSPYAESKAMADDLCTIFQPYHPITIIRPFNIFGIGMNETTGSIIWSFLQGIKKGKIIVNGSGEQTRDFINVRDVVEVIKAAISPKWNGKTVDVATGKLVTINYIADLFAHFGKSSLIYKGEPKREIKWSKANLQMLNHLYKKKLTTNLVEDIKEIIKYYE